MKSQGNEFNFCILNMMVYIDSLAGAIAFSSNNNLN